MLMVRAKGDQQRQPWEFRLIKSGFLGCRFVAFILLLCFPLCGSAQRNNSAPETLFPLKSSLPELFSGIPIQGFIGISDPGADSATAYNQAFLRAVSMYNLSNGIGRGLSDYFTNDDNQTLSSKYEELCELKATCRISGASLKTAAPIRLNTGEIILLLTVDSTLAQKTDLLEVKSSISLYYKENSSDNSLCMQRKMLLETSCKPVGMPGGHQEKLKNVCINNRWVNKETVFDNTLIDNAPYKMFYYMDQKCSVSTTDFSSGTGKATFEGLWYALINSTYHQLSVQLKQQFQKEKSLGERYVKKQSLLSREVGFFRFKCLIESMQFCDNQLYVR
ncbi:MAG: hypothetical protein NTY32_03520, partial [Bacteroidia bacterium]|nr:hypothetical protein [Bacteroidia bacterium]